MKRFNHTSMQCPAFLLILAFLFLTSNIALADDYYRRPGTGSYGVSNEKIECPNCGRIISKYDSHMCRRQNSSSSSSSRSSGSSSGNMSAAEAEAIMAGHPELLVNQTSFTPVDYSQMQNSSSGNMEEEQESSYRDKASEVLHTFPATSKKKIHKTRNIILTVIVLCVIWYLFRKAKKRRSKANNTLTPESTRIASDMNDKIAETTLSGRNTATACSASFKKHYSKVSKKINDISCKASETIANAKKTDEVQKIKSNLNNRINSAKEKLQTALENRMPRSNSTSIADEIAKLNELRKSGAITEEEYQKLKMDTISKK